ncbi:hypothetical protein [Vitiosangium sp. GDMCC 1.1324]|uniref:hypothetical protein n=1 Tax=Vitiosangium sp. (strain GDMCC 1.1324) TaxID=2138576 RepID=UPI000D35A125|nr:hypothetical protein [Vitiosangium sp. GDMCC 1.1324]PTL85045.1 hypothetical protein DAT35_08375 [Vitiosangium sp. GDMCC 1.1324]
MDPGLYEFWRHMFEPRDREAQLDSWGLHRLSTARAHLPYRPFTSPPPPAVTHCPATRADARAMTKKASWTTAA